MPDTKLFDTLKSVISRKARWVSRRYPMLRYSDLVQEGILLVLELHQTKNISDTAYLLKAVRNHYAKMMRQARQIYKHHVPLSHSDELVDTRLDQDFYKFVDDDIDLARFRAHLKNPLLLSIVDGLNNGQSIKDIARQHKRSTRHVYRLVNQISNIRYQWEKRDKA